MAFLRLLGMEMRAGLEGELCSSSEPELVAEDGYDWEGLVLRGSEGSLWLWGRIVARWRDGSGFRGELVDRSHLDF